MTIPAGQSGVTYHTGNGTASTFDYEFKITAEADLKVTQTDTAGVDTVLVLNTDYTVTGVGNNAGGSITLVAGALASNYTLAIEDNVEVSQLTPFGNQSAFYANLHEDAYDKNTRIARKSIYELDRVLKIPASVQGVDTELPKPEGLNLFRWNEDGTALENVETADLITTAQFSNFKTDTFVDGIDFTAGTTTTVTLDSAPGTKANTQVYFDGVYQEKSEYSLAATVITFDNPIPIGVGAVEVVYGKAADVLASSTREVQIADGVATAFTLSNSYEPGNGTLHVYINGVRQEVGYGYTETDANTVTFDSAPDLSDTVLFLVNPFLPQTTADAYNVTYTRPAVGAVATNVGARLSQTVSVKDFGALGDGVTDDTTAIQAAIDYASSLVDTGVVRDKAAAVHFPTGEYNIESSLVLTQGVHLEGNGSMLSTQNEITLIKVDTQHNSGTRRNITINNFSFRAYSVDSQSTIAIQAFGIGHSKIEFCKFYDFYIAIDGRRLGQGTIIDSCWFLTNNRTNVSTPALASIVIDGGVTGGETSSGVYIINNEMWGDSSINVLNSHILIKSVDGCYVFNNHMYYAFSNIKIDPRTVEQNADGSDSATPYPVTIMSPRFVGNYFDTTYNHNIRITGSTGTANNWLYQRISFSDCTIRNGGSTNVFIDVSDGGGTPLRLGLQEISFDNCIIDSAGTNAINVLGEEDSYVSVNGLRVTNNSFTDNNIDNTAATIIHSDIEYGTISSNTFGESRYSNSYCIRVQTTADVGDSYVDAVIISDNDFSASNFSVQPIFYEAGTGNNSYNQNNNLMPGIGKRIIEFAKAQSTDASQTDLLSHLVNAGESGVVRAKIVGRDSGGDNYCVYEHEQGFTRTDAGALSLLGSADVRTNQISGLGTPSFAVGATTLYVRAVGAAATNVDWIAEIELIVVG